MVDVKRPLKNKKNVGGRPEGSKPRLKKGDCGYRAPGRKPGGSSILKRLGKFTDEQILDLKYEILKLMTEGGCATVTEACKVLKLNPALVYSWSQNDPDFKSMVRMTHEVAADELEAKFRTHPNFIPGMMLLKGYRPQFRDNYKEPPSSLDLMKLLEELRNLGNKKESGEPVTDTKKGGIE